MGDQDVVEALSGPGCLEGGAVEAVRGEPSDDPQIGSIPANWTGIWRPVREGIRPTHRSTTDADSRLYRKGRGKEAKLSYMGHALMENRDGLVVDGLASRATGAAECLAGEVTVYRAPTRRAIELCRPGGFALQSAWATNSGKRMLRFPTNAAGIAIPEGLAASVDVIHPAADGRSAASGRNLKSGYWGGSRWSLPRGRLLHKRRPADWSTIPGSRDSLSLLHR